MDWYELRYVQEAIWRWRACW